MTASDAAVHRHAASARATNTSAPFSSQWTSRSVSSVVGAGWRHPVSVAVHSSPSPPTSAASQLRLSSPAAEELQFAVWRR